MANPAFDGTSIEWWQERGGADYQDDLHEYMHGDMYDVSCEYNCSNGVASTMDWQSVIDIYRLHGGGEDHRCVMANEWINELYQEIQDWYDSEMADRSEREYFNREWAI
jgi:hypothetical protein